MPITKTAPSRTEITLFRRLLENGRERMTPQLARYVLGLDFSAEDKAHMHELAQKAQAGKLTAAERQEIDSYGKAGSLLGVLQSKARQTLKKLSKRS